MVLSSTAYMLLFVQICLQKYGIRREEISAISPDIRECIQGCETRHYKSIDYDGNVSDAFSIDSEIPDDIFKNCLEKVGEDDCEFHKCIENYVPRKQKSPIRKRDLHQALEQLKAHGVHF